MKKNRIGIFHRGIAPNDIQSFREVRFMFMFTERRAEWQKAYVFKLHLQWLELQTHMLS